MAILDSTLDLQSFYPSDLKIFSVDDTEDKIIIHMHSVSTSCTCHRCGALLYRHHGSHHRTVQDLPILGKQVILICRFMIMSAIVKPANLLRQRKPLTDFSTIIAG